jgi:hypothetical protein
MNQSFTSTTLYIIINCIMVEKIITPNFWGLGPLCRVIGEAKSVVSAQKTSLSMVSRRIFVKSIVY